MSTTASYTQLRDGSWGIRVPGQIAAGATVAVRKKDGSTKSETVVRVLWSGRDSKTGQTVSLCSISHSGSGSGGQRTCADCGATLAGSKYRYCYDCGLEHRDGGSRHAGGMSYYDSHGNFVLGDDD